MTDQQYHEAEGHTADYGYRYTCSVCRAEDEDRRQAARDAKYDAILAGWRPEAVIADGTCDRCGTYCDGDCQS